MVKDDGSETRVPGELPQIIAVDINEALYEKHSLDVVPKNTQETPAENPFKNLLKPAQSENSAPTPASGNDNSHGKK